MIDRKEFFRAMLIALRHALVTFEWPEAVGRAIHLVPSLLRAYRHKATILSEMRLAACEKCPFFYAPLKTCGSPLGSKETEWYNGNTNRTEQAGCYCYMPVKVRDPQSVCWLHEQGVDDMGWATDLDGKL